MEAPSPGGGASREWPVPERNSFIERLASEVAFVRRKGGMLSLLLIGVRSSTPGSMTAAQVRSAASLFQGQLRVHDVLGLVGSTIAILLPATTAAETTRVAMRLLSLAAARDPAAGTKLSAGQATVFGEVEGGADALVAAAQEALEGAAPGQAAASSLSGRPSVLVVDDDLPFAQLLAEMLSERGWEGHPCTSIPDALRRVADPTYSALFVDLVLSEGSGIEVLREALSTCPRRPVVLMSGHAVDQAAIIRVLELGPVLFIKKPITPADLDTATEMLCDCLPGAARPTGQRTR